MNTRALLLAAAVTLTTPTGAAVAEDRTPSEIRNVDTVVRLFTEGWGATPGWEEVWRETMAADFRFFFHSHPPREGLEEGLAFNRALFDGFPDLAVEIEEIVAEDDVVVVRARLAGSQDGVFLGVPPSGNAVDVPDITLFRFADGKVVEQHYFTDLLAVMSAIGATAPPVE